MLRLISVPDRSDSDITFYTKEIKNPDMVSYIMYDTSTGNNIETTKDYYSWRATSWESSTGAMDAYIKISNGNVYPSLEGGLSDYSNLNLRNFKIMTFQEYSILNSVLDRLDLVRKRLPNPGTGISSTDGFGQNGVVSYVGGFEKKMTIGEIGRMMEGTIIELNMTPPQTFFYPAYSPTLVDEAVSPYTATMGVPYDMTELIVQGTMIRCLIALGILEVDIHFTTSDAGLNLSFDRVGHMKGWHDALLTQYKEDKTLFKWNHADHGGMAVGTMPWAAYGIWGTMMNNVTYGGMLAYSSVLGMASRGNTPM